MSLVEYFGFTHGSVDASRCKPDPRSSSSEVSETTGTTTSGFSLSSSSTYDSSTGTTTFEQSTTSSSITISTTLTETESSTSADPSSTSSDASTTTDTTRSDSLTTVTSPTETFTSTSGVSSTESVTSTTETSTDPATETSATETTTTQSTSEISTTTTTTAEYCVPTDLNYIQNPGFEKVNDRGSVDFSPWVLQNDWTHVTASDSLAHGQGELFVGIQVNDSSMPKRSVSQTINGLVVGKQYTLSYYWMVYNGYPPNTISCYHEVSIEVSPWREYNDIIKGFQPRYWEQHEYTFPAVFEQQTISIIVYCDQPVTESFFVFLDDFKLRPAGVLCSDG
ncbi:hypothetical protein FALBO_8381 [Fusarium albosuccineum]|uniref:CBM-cenC domain-containing protein n=1 Tax=Fusarium albosuccineum TaxID=1237068 RepID=A0A8H4LAR8_9HYPO|nr:hypothetical protein FALBO_8381 [Fusarium albosuccineum]